MEEQNNKNEQLTNAQLELQVPTLPAPARSSA